MSSIYDTRQQNKRLLEAYREAARNGVETSRSVNPHVNVHPLEDGAYVEVAVWIERWQAEVYLPKAAVAITTEGQLCLPL